MDLVCLYSFEFVLPGGLSHLSQILIACLVQMLVSIRWSFLFQVDTYLHRLVPRVQVEVEIWWSLSVL